VLKFPKLKIAIILKEIHLLARLLECQQRSYYREVSEGFQAMQAYSLQVELGSRNIQ
jgi:hypothetical protein